MLNKKFTNTKHALKGVSEMEIGPHIKQLRIKNGLTLEELASRTELTKGFLSQLENDMTSPSIATLIDILEALGTTLSEFFKEPRVGSHVYDANDFFTDVQEHYTLNWIIPDAQSKEMEPLLIELNENGESFVMEPHEGEEFGLVLQGKIKLVFANGEEEVVKKGETFYIDGSNSEYHLKNIDKAKSKVLWVSTPPSF